MEPNSLNYTFKSYIFFWSGQLFSLLGSSIVQFTIIWWVTEVTQSPMYLSIAAFLSVIPMVILTPFAGVFIDRWNRKLIIGITDSLQALTTFFIVVIFLFDLGMVAVWPVILINAMRGIFQAFHFPTTNAIIPLMVPKEHLSRLNAISYLFISMINFFGPVIAGSLLLFFTVEQVLWVDIITFVIAIIPLLLIKIPSIKRQEETDTKQSFFTDFSSGIKILVSVPGLLLIFLFISVINLLNSPWGTQLPYFVNITHSGEVQDYSLVVALSQLGVLIGATIALSKKNWEHKITVIFVGVLIGITGLIISTLAPYQGFIMIGIGGLIHTMMMPIANTNFLTILQTNVPLSSQGRVFSVVVSIAMAVSPIGMIFSGLLVEIIGIRILFLACAILQLIFVITIWFFTNIRHVDFNKGFESSPISENTVNDEE